MKGIAVLPDLLEIPLCGKPTAIMWGYSSCLWTGTRIEKPRLDTSFPNLWIPLLYDQGPDLGKENLAFSEVLLLSQINCISGLQVCLFPHCRKWVWVVFFKCCLGEFLSLILCLRLLMNEHEPTCFSVSHWYLQSVRSLQSRVCQSLDTGCPRSSSLVKGNFL